MKFSGVAEDPKTAFYLKFSGKVSAANNAVIIFNQKVLDSANAYDSGNGIYTVPESGTYIFTWTVYCRGHEWATTQLMINNYEYGKSFANSEEINDTHTSTGLVVATVKQGDTVFVRFGSSANSGYLYSLYATNTFSGWILG